MKVFRTSQYIANTPLNQQMQDWYKLDSELGLVKITGTGADISINFNGKMIPVRPLLENAINLIQTELKENGIKEVDTSPLNPNVQGLAVSNQPGKIHIDVEKIARNFENSAQPAVTQTDGTVVDEDSEDHLTAMITRELLGTAAHESAHNADYWQEYNKYRQNPQQGGPRFDRVQEAPGPAYENKILNQFKSQFARTKIYELKQN